ncbi:Transmembrane protein 95 [Myotis davidii]|uniref:Transmembrane protein 95 n=1 Tax=Myotis davidii TaxID=225400 RepID=L5M250_MYODS|nr:Transmembrane protein 95 [Myotis davidii]
MWTLALSVALLEAAQACLFCRLPAHGLSGRLARLCSQIEAQWEDCEASWNFSTFALDEESMNKVTEKTHRVLRVMGGSTILYNCSTCEGFEVLCWPQKRCFPGSHDLREARILLLCVCGTILLMGVLSLVVE